LAWDGHLSEAGPVHYHCLRIQSDRIARSGVN